MKLTQLTSPWDHGVSVTYQAFDFAELEDAVRCEDIIKRAISYGGNLNKRGWFRFFKGKKTECYIYLN